jgi:rubrerythrin
MVEATRPAGLSVWEAALLDHLTEHLHTEAELLAAYQLVVDRAESDYASYLFALIIEDEVRHHRLFEELANALRAPVERTVGAQVPAVETVANPSTLLKVTERLLAAENADARELKRLVRHKDLRLMRGHSLWPLLIELMEHDTEKHQKILRFIRAQLREDLRNAAPTSPDERSPDEQRS